MQMIWWICFTLLLAQWNHKCRMLEQKYNCLVTPTSFWRGSISCYCWGELLRAVLSQSNLRSRKNHWWWGTESLCKQGPCQHVWGLQKSYFPKKNSVLFCKLNAVAAYWCCALLNHNTCLFCNISSFTRAWIYLTFCPGWIWDLYYLWQFPYFVYLWFVSMQQLFTLTIVGSANLLWHHPLVPKPPIFLCSGLPLQVLEVT